jgi:hypothetical protein
MLKGKSVLPDEETLLKEYSAKIKDFAKNIGKNNKLEYKVVVDDVIKNQIEELKKKHGAI